LDPAKDQEIREYMERRKAGMPDALA
jgi:hypothetical protein